MSTLNLIYKYGGIFSPFPYKNNIPKVCCLILWIILITTYSTLKYYEIENLKANLANLEYEKIWFTVTYFCIITMVNVCYIYDKMRNHSPWEKFMNNINDLDRYGKRKSIFSCCVQIFFFSLPLLLNHVYVVSFLLNFSISLESMKNSFLELYEVFTDIQLTYFCVVVWEICNIFSDRCDYLGRFIKRSFSIEILYRDRFMEDIKLTKKYLVRLDKEIVIFNSLTGKLLFLLIVFSSVYIINQFLFVFLFVGNQMTNVYVAVDILTTLAFSIIPILSCDKIEKKLDELAQTCVYIQSKTGDPHAKDLVIMTKLLNRKYSAAGFFDVNQRLLPQLFSGLMTYLIVILQFNVAVFKKYIKNDVEKVN
uniref:Uncharacterized protein LOC114334897 isoform X1 n=1 Tax=Diabrotica virgifera virgifera TaxID=50390 RepID=A0A6P7G7L2_DIAVI